MFKDFDNRQQKLSEVQKCSLAGFFQKIHSVEL